MAVARGLGLLGLASLFLLAACGTPSGSWVETGAGPASYDTSPILAGLPGGVVLAAGGSVFGDPSPQAFLYNPGTHQWDVEPAMSSARGGAAAAELRGGEVLVAGGAMLPAAPFDYSDTAEIWQPLGGWQAPITMPGARSNMTALALRDGRVLLVGGVSAGGAARDAWIFDPGDRTFHVLHPLLQPRVAPAAVQLPSGRVLVVGGEPGPAPITAEELDLGTGQWSPATSPGGTTMPALGVLGDGTVLSVQGQRTGPGGEVPDTCSYMRPNQQGWMRAGCPSVQLVPTGIEVVGGTAELVGWSPADGLTRIAAYRGDGWTVSQPLQGGVPQAWAPLSRGRLLVVQFGSYGIFDPSASGAPVLGGTFASRSTTEVEVPVAVVLLVLLAWRWRRARQTPLVSP